MPNGLKTLTRYTIEEEHRHPGSSGEFSALVNVVATAAKIIANQVTRGAIIGSGVDDESSVSGRLDALTDEIMVGQTQWSGHLSGLLSEQHATVLPAAQRRGKYLLAYDALDGSSNIDVNLPVGSIFSILRAPDAVVAGDAEPAEADFLQPGVEQVCAGFTLYGPATMLVLTTGRCESRRTLRDSRSMPPMSGSGSGRCAGTYSSAWKVWRVRADAISICGGWRRWWPTPSTS